MLKEAGEIVALSITESQIRVMLKKMDWYWIQRLPNMYAMIEIILLYGKFGSVTINNEIMKIKGVGKIRFKFHDASMKILDNVLIV